MPQKAKTTQKLVKYHKSELKIQVGQLHEQTQKQSLNLTTSPPPPQKKTLIEAPNIQNNPKIR